MNNKISYPAYIMGWEYDHLVDMETDADLQPFPGIENIAGWLGESETSVPEHIYFDAAFDSLEKIDYPVNDQDWPIMSQRVPVKRQWDH